LKTQLEAACKLYNTLLHAEQEEYEENKRTMSMNELRQLALDLRKQNKEFQALHSQVAQQVADRFYEARQRFFEGLANKPKKAYISNIGVGISAKSHDRTGRQPAKSRPNGRATERLCCLGLEMPVL